MNNAVLLDADLNLIKKHLLFRSDQTWQQWLELAAKYKDRGSWANYSGCMWRAMRLGAPSEVAPAALGVDVAPGVDVSVTAVLEAPVAEHEDYTDV